MVAYLWLFFFWLAIIAIEDFNLKELYCRLYSGKNQKLCNGKETTFHRKSKALLESYRQFTCSRLKKKDNFEKQQLMVTLPHFLLIYAEKIFLWDPHINFFFLVSFFPKPNERKTHLPFIFSLPIFFLLLFSQTKRCVSDS